MAIVTPATFKTTYADVAGTFADNSTRQITESDLRNFATDIADSTLFYTGVSAAFSTSVTISQATMLTANTTPVTIVAAQGTGIIINPIAFLVYIQFGSAAFATNTTFRFEINGVAVSATNTTILPSVASRTAIVPLAALDTTTDLSNKALVLEVQTGNPTLGTGSIVFVNAIYSTISVA